MIRDLGKALDHQAFQLVQRLRSDHGQVHYIGIVVAMIEVDHPLTQRRLALWRVGQGVTAAHGKAGGGVRRVEQLVQDVVLAPRFITYARHVLGVDDIAFALQLVGIEQR